MEKQLKKFYAAFSLVCFCSCYKKLSLLLVVGFFLVMVKGECLKTCPNEQKKCFLICYN